MIEGEKRHRLTLVRFTTPRRGRALFRCDCGSEIEREVCCVASASTKSCGCLKAETSKTACRVHGEVQHINGKRVPSPEYRAWQLMKNRCLNPRSKDFKYNGGRGITICPQWVSSVAAFIADMGRRPTSHHTLDRIDSNGNYEPGNCRWATRKEQARNRPYAATKAWVLAERLGLKQMTVHHMIWQVRAKDRGDTKWFALSPELEQVVRDFLSEVEHGEVGANCC